MTARAVRNEFAKLRHLHVGVLAGLLVLGVVGLTSVGVAAGGVDDLSWATLLASASLAVPLASPLLIAVLASRSVDVEHQDGGWLPAATAGTGRGGLCRAKLVATGAVLAAATLAASLAIAGVGLLGAGAPAPVGLWAGYTASVLVIDLALLALHVLLAARVENQLVGLGVGIVGTVFGAIATGFPAWLGHLTPWGYYALAAAADYRGGQVVTLTPAYASVAALGVVTAAAFWFVTHRLDRQQA